MSEPINIQDLIDGRLDIQSLGEAANGDENTTVVTRTGETYPSAKKAIKTMFAAGGLPANPFPTRAKMITDGASLIEGSYALVTDDKTVVGGAIGGYNGLYVKIGTIWTKTSYDPIGLSKFYTDSVRVETLATAATDAATKAAQAQANAIAASATDANTKDIAVLAQSKQYTDNAQLALSSSMQATITSNVLASAQAAIDSAAASGGYIIIDSFELGATITKRNQVLRLSSNGAFYRWAGGLPKTVPAGSTPATSGGIGETGWLLVSMSAKTAYNSMFSLLSDKNSFEDGKMYTISSFYSGKNAGGGDYVYMSSVDKATANGGSIIDPDKMGTLTSTNVQAQLKSYLDGQGTGVGTGCLVRLNSEEHTAEMYGGLPNIPTFDCTPCFRKIMATVTAPTIRLLAGIYHVKANVGKVPAINLTNGTVVKGAGMYNSYLKNMDDSTILSIPIGGYGTQYTTLQDFGVDGNRQRFANGFYKEGEGIDFDKNAKNITIKNVHVKETMGEAIDIDSATDLYIDNVYLENCSGNGLHISDPQPPRYCNVSNVTAVGCAIKRGESGDLRAGGAVLRVSNLNITNLIIRDCWLGILHNGQEVPATSREHTSITNLAISGSVKEDIHQTHDSSGLQITNFVISRAADNVYPATITADVGKSLRLNQGEFIGTASINLLGSAVFGRTGMNLTDVVAPNINLNLRGFGSSSVPWHYVTVSGGVFKDINITSLRGFSFSGVSCDNLNLAGLLYNGTIMGNIISGSVTEAGSTVPPRQLTFIGNRVGVAIASTFLNNSFCQILGNSVA